MNAVTVIWARDCKALINGQRTVPEATKVAGVSGAEVDYDKRQAVVTFDDAKTTVEALIRATTEAGYPSTVKGTVQ